MAEFPLKAVITAEDRTGSAFKSASSSISNLQSGVSSLAGNFLKVGTVAVGAFVAATGFAVKSAADVQMLRSNLDVLTGSAENGAKMFKQIYDMAAKTPFETTDLVNASKTLLAFGTTAEDIIPTLKMLGDVSLGNKGQFDQLALAYGQIQAKGRLMGQELLQLTNVGFNPLKQISERTGESMESLTKKMEKGQISMDMVKKEFQIATSEGGRFFGGMDKGSKTLEGTVSTLKDNIGMLARKMVGLSDTGDVVKGGLFDKLSIAVVNLNEWFDKNQDKVNQLAETVSTALKSAIQWLIDNIPKLIKWFKEHEGTVKAIAVALGVMTAGILLGAAAIAIIANWMAILIGIGISLQTFIIVQMIGSLKQFWKMTVESWNKMKEAWSTGIDSVKTFALNLWTSVTGFFTKLWNDIKTGWQVGIDFLVFYFQNFPYLLGLALGLIAEYFVNFITVTVPNFIIAINDWFKQLPGRIWDVMVSVWNVITTWFTNSYNSAVDWVSRAVTDVSDWFHSLPGRVAEAISNLWNTVEIGAFNIKNSFTHWFSNAIETVVDWFRELPGRISAQISRIGGVIGQFLSGTSKGFNIGISNKALGGSVSSGSPYIVGEKGPELFVPNTSGRIIPNNQITNNDNGVTVNFYGNIANTANASLDAIGARISRQIQLASQGI